MHYVFEPKELLQIFLKKETDKVIINEHFFQYEQN